MVNLVTCHDISEHKKNKNTLWLFEFILFKKVSKLQDAIITIDTVKCTCTLLTSEFHIYTICHVIFGANILN